MELLLILAAMLSAVTGAFTGARGPDARVGEPQAAVGAAVAVAAVEQQAVRALPVRPANIVMASEVPALPAFAIVAAVPLYADRLIE